MIAWLMLKLGAPKWAIYAGIVVLLLGALGTAKCAYDRSIIKAHDAERDAATAKADRAADAKSAEERRADDSRLAQETQEVKEAVDEARSEGRDPRAAYYACVKLQQSARARGEPPADC